MVEEKHRISNEDKTQLLIVRKICAEGKLSASHSSSQTQIADMLTRTLADKQSKKSMNSMRAMSSSRGMFEEEL